MIIQTDFITLKGTKEATNRNRLRKAFKIEAGKRRLRLPNTQLHKQVHVHFQHLENI